MADLGPAEQVGDFGKAASFDISQKQDGPVARVELLQVGQVARIVLVNNWVDSARPGSDPAARELSAAVRGNVGYRPPYVGEGILKSAEWTALQSACERFLH